MQQTIVDRIRTRAAPRHGIPLAAALICSLASAALAQTPPAAPAPQQPPAQQAPAQQQPAPQQFQPSAEWERLPRMQLERQFGGPLRDTLIQRLRDPIDGTVCYIYLPITAPHTPPTSTGFVQYGPNEIGSISCQFGSSRPAAMPSARK